jgi:cysteine desulfurase/selenocysteine lyase
LIALSETAHAPRRGGLDVARIREDFPALRQEVHGRPLVYLDNAASMLKPAAVIEAVTRHYQRDSANVHRGVHSLSQRATQAYEESRETVRRFLNAREAREIVFVRGTTEAINLVAHSYSRPRVSAGDEILLTGLEHHSNIVPWQMLCSATGARLCVVPVTDQGEVRLEDLETRLTSRTRLVAIAHVSNALGTVLPVAEIVGLAHARGVPVLVDGAQASGHLPVDVIALGCDFYAFSGHKTCGPTGVGVLYGRAEILSEMPPYQGGGDMIERVTFEETTFADIPTRFEAGTPNVGGAIGLRAAVDYLSSLGMESIARWDAELLDYAAGALSEIPGLRILGTAREKSGVISFVLDGIHPHDVGTVLDHQGIAVRTGHHCAQPLMERFGVPATTRASFALYNTFEDVDALVAAIHRVREFFSP